MKMTVKDRLDFCEEFIRNLRLQIIEDSKWMIGKHFGIVNKSFKYKEYLGEIESVDINIGILHLRNIVYDYVINYKNDHKSHSKNKICTYCSEEAEDIIIGDSEEEVRLELELEDI